MDQPPEVVLLPVGAGHGRSASPADGGIGDYLLPRLQRHREARAAVSSVARGLSGQGLVTARRSGSGSTVTWLGSWLHSR